MLMFLASVYVLILLSSGSVMIFMAGGFVGALTLIWSILMVKCISKVPVYNGVNDFMGWVFVNVSCLDKFKDKFC